MVRNVFHRMLRFNCCSSRKKPIPPARRVMTYIRSPFLSDRMRLMYPSDCRSRRIFSVCASSGRRSAGNRRNSSHGEHRQLPLPSQSVYNACMTFRSLPFNILFSPNSGKEGYHARAESTAEPCRQAKEEEFFLLFPLLRTHSLYIHPSRRQGMQTVYAALPIGITHVDVATVDEMIEQSVQPLCTLSQRKRKSGQQIRPFHYFIMPVTAQLVDPIEQYFPSPVQHFSPFPFFLLLCPFWTGSIPGKKEKNSSVQGQRNLIFFKNPITAFQQQRRLL